ncbi:MAG: hypothetical protein JW839_09410 [Candidatus Lokiarchaeota archaeon]|nr:hypothetical protein [Candidatus Lokiarchaeota archaeon]
MSKQRNNTEGFRVELENLLAWSGINSLLAGLLLVAIWAAFEFIDEVAQYMHYAAPLITIDILTVALVLGIVNLAHFFVDMVGFGLVHAGNEKARVLCLASALMQVWMPPAGTFFGVILLSLYRNWPGLAGVPGAGDVDSRPMQQVLYLAATYLASCWLFILLVIEGVYILPMEFFNDADLIWLRFNIWNICYAAVAFLGALTGFFVVALVLAAKRVRGWRGALYVECFLLLFSLPIGTYLAGVFYRNLLRKRE